MALKYDDSFLYEDEEQETNLAYDDSFLYEDEPERVNESTGEPLLKQRETYSLDRDTPDTEFGKVAERVKLMQTSGMGGVARSFVETPGTFSDFMNRSAETLEDYGDPENISAWQAGSTAHQLLTDFVGAGIKTGLVDLADMFTAGDIRDDTKEATAIVSEEASRILGSEEMQYEGSDLGKFGYQVAEGAANMVPALVVGWGTKNPGLSLGMMGAEVYGLTYNEYMDKTGEHYTATAAAEFHTLAEIIPETIPVMAILRKAKAGEGIKRLLEATVGEGAQEMLTEVLQGTYDRQELEGMSLKDAILGIDWGNVAHAGALGFFIGGGLAVPGMVADAAVGRQRYDQQGQPPELFSPSHKAGGGQDVMQATRKGKPIPDTYVTRDGQVVRDTNAIQNEESAGSDPVVFDVSATVESIKTEIGMDESDPYGLGQPVDLLPDAQVPGLIASHIPSAPMDLTGEQMEDNVRPLPEPMDIVGSVMAETSLDEEANKASTSPQNDLIEPTEGQKEAGNYQKAHVTVQGKRIAIENPAGSKRNPEWPTLNWHYGYEKGTIGADSTPGAAPHEREQVDVFVRPEDQGGPIPDTNPVYIIDQTNEDGTFDEHKVMRGANSEAHARAVYLANYTPGWTGLGAITQLTPEQYDEWLNEGDQQVAYNPDLRPEGYVRDLSGDEWFASQPDPVIQDRDGSEWFESQRDPPRDTGDAWADPAEAEMPEVKRATPVPKQKAPDEDYAPAVTPAEAKGEAWEAVDTPQQKALRESQKKGSIPSKLYHGSGESGITEFKSPEIPESGQFAGAGYGENPPASPSSLFGVWMTDSTEAANEYAGEHVLDDVFGKKNPTVYAPEVNADNPYRMPYEEFQQYENAGTDAAVEQFEMGETDLENALAEQSNAVLERKEQLIAQGYDSIVVKLPDGSTSVAVFDPVNVVLPTGEPTIGDTSKVDTKEPGRSEPGINEKTGKYNAAENLPEDSEVKDDGAGQQSLFDTGEGSQEQAADTFFIGYAQVETGTFSTAHDTVNSPGEVAHMIASIRKHAQELFLAVVTDAKGKVLNIIRHSKGTIDTASVYPGVMVGAIAGTEGAAKVWFAHNHPSGVSTPSSADIKITRKIEDLSDGLSLEMMGHVVIGDGEFTYFDTDGIVTDGVEKIPPATRKKRVSVTERMLRKRRSGPKHGLASPAEVRRYINRLKSESGILLLDTKLRPVGVVSITTAEMAMLRDGEQVKRIWSAMDKTNTGSVIMFAQHSNETRERDRVAAIQNLGNFLQKTDARVLDAFVDGASLMESGDTLGNKSAPFFRRGDPYAKYDGKLVTIPITVEETGITYTAEMDAGNIMREMETRLDALEKLRKCL